MRAPIVALLAVASLICLSASRCSGLGPGGSEGSLTILAYNVHNLFDAKDEGSEYSEFSVARGRWDEGRYRSRLTAVGKVVAAALPGGDWPDILCLEEVENEAVLRDLAAGPLKAGGYKHIGMAPAAGSPINCGILSAFPIVSLKAHGLAASGTGAQAPSRSLLEAKIEARGTSITVFVVHWKSKVEGAEATEGARREAAALLADRVELALEADPSVALVACGDFNENPDEYIRIGRRYPTALMPEDEAGSRLSAKAEAARLLLAAKPDRAGRRAGGEPVLYSPWAGDSGYSYSYKGKRERLDGFLLSPGLLDGEGFVFRGFSTVDAPFLLDAEGAPLGWSPASPGGYSDHLPVLLVLEEATR